MPRRIGWPKVAEYEYGEGRYAAPPMKPETSFRMVIHDLAEYERMFKAGWFHDPRHTGKPRPTLIDNRNTS